MADLIGICTHPDSEAYWFDAASTDEPCPEAGCDCQPAFFASMPEIESLRAQLRAAEGRAQRYRVTAIRAVTRLVEGHEPGAVARQLNRVLAGADTEGGKTERALEIREAIAKHRKDKPLSFPVNPSTEGDDG